MTTKLDTQQLTTILGGFVRGAKTNFEDYNIAEYDRNIEALSQTALIALEKAKGVEGVILRGSQILHEDRARYKARAIAVFDSIHETASDLHSTRDPETEAIWERLDIFEANLRSLHEYGKHALK